MESLLLGRRQEMRPAGAQIKAGSGQRGKDRERTARQNGREGPSELVLVPTWIRQLPELQVDPIFDSLHHDWSGHRELEGIQRQLKVKQDQGHGHLQLIHGKLLPMQFLGKEGKRKRAEASNPC